MTFAVTDEAVETLAIEPEQLRIIRNLRAEWSWRDAGAPRLTLVSAGADDCAIVERVREVTGPWLVSDETLLLSAYRRGISAVPAFVAGAQLAVGAFEYESPFPPSRLEQEPFVRSPRVQIRGSTIRMELTREHLALLKAANVRLFDDGGWKCEAAIDPCVPYGATASLYEEMARILGVKMGMPADEGDPSDWNEAELAWLHDLHLTLEPALQILLRQGELER
jgi:hypothetical protein